MARMCMMHLIALIHTVFPVGEYLSPVDNPYWI